MIESIPLTIELQIGYRDKSGAVHRRVTFGKRITGRMLFDIDSDPQGNDQTQYADLIARAAITEFGTVSLPVPLLALLQLDSVDRDAISEGLSQFLGAGLGERKVEIISENQIKLAVGYESNGLVYDMVYFGRAINGYDEIEANRLKLEGVRRVCFLAGKQVVKLSQSEGSSGLDGPIGLSIFEKLDSVDIQAIRVASEVWRRSFRRISERAKEVGASEKPAAAR